MAAKSAICLEPASASDEADVVIYEKDADRPMPPASITKLLTAIVAIRVAENTALSNRFKLEVTAGDIAEGSGRNVCAGDRLSFGDGIANLLLPSSNVMANAIARTFGRILLGSERCDGESAVQRFVFEMNLVARSLGMVNSRFMNPHGLGIRGQKSTARDLSSLTKACLAYERITGVWGRGTYVISIDGPKARKLEVKSAFHTSTQRAVPNFVLPPYLGGKTGSLWPSYFNLAAISPRDDGGCRISVVLGSPSVSDRYFDYLRLVETPDKSRMDVGLPALPIMYAGCEHEGRSS